MQTRVSGVGGPGHLHGHARHDEGNDVEHLPKAQFLIFNLHLVIFADTASMAWIGGLASRALQGWAR
jgi:hypothetical protein